MVEDDDDVLTDPPGWTWTEGPDHDPVEPTWPLLPGRVDRPASIHEGSSAVGQFDTHSAAAAAADVLSSICVAQTVILPGQPYPWGGPADQDILTAVIDQLNGAGSRDAFITDADTGYYTQLDIRAHCTTRGEALAIGRQMAPIEWPPWLRGLIKPWAPGRKLSEEHVRARLYIASLWRRSDRKPRDELESKIWEVWRAWREEQDEVASQLLTGAGTNEGSKSTMEAYVASLHSMLGEEPEEWGLPWYLSWQIRVDNADVCLSFVSCHVATGFPALVRWLRESGVESANYAVYNLMRP